MICKTCGAELIQRSRGLLFLVGVLMIASVILSPIGLFLVVWATRGKGRWCRACKRIGFS
jgi:hypothetical protein